MSAAADLSSVLDTLRARNAEARIHGVELVGVVGSIARGEARPDSDVDVIYQIVGRPSLFDLGRLQMDLQDDLGREVDLIDLNQVKPRLRVAMERDLARL